MSHRHLNLDDLIRAQRAGVSMSDEQRAANRVQVLSRALAGGVAGATVGAKVASALPAKAAGILAGSGLVRFGVAVLLAGSAGIVYVATRPAPELAPPYVRPAPPALARPVAVERAAEAPPPLPEAASANASTDKRPLPRHAASSPSGAIATPSLASEVQLMHDVESALHSNQPQRALALLDQHRGDGLLVEERAVAHIVTLCALGRGDAARTEAADFLRAHPRSPLAARVRGTCSKPADPRPDNER